MLIVTGTACAPAPDVAVVTVAKTGFAPFWQTARTILPLWSTSLAPKVTVAEVAEVELMGQMFPAPKQPPGVAQPSETLCGVQT